MKKYAIILFLAACICNSFSAIAVSLWQRVHSGQSPFDTRPVHPKYLLYSADETVLRARLNMAARGDARPEIELPMPDGTSRAFYVRSSGLLPPALAAKYPGLATYDAAAVDNALVTAKLDLTAYGFHAMVFDGKDIIFIDPENNQHDGYYTVHYKSDEVREPEAMMKCLVKGDDNKAIPSVSAAMKTTGTGFLPVSNGYDLRTYRLALSCDYPYADSVTGLAAPVKEQVLSKMITTMNRVNGVYERELSITMVFVEHEDTLINITAAGDTFILYNSDASTLLGINQIFCDERIGSANYDIGHIFSTGAGGLSQLGCACNAAYKAQSVTGSAVPKGDGFDIDYVAHEMGHEFGSQHTFNDDISAACTNNAVAACAYEPGSGTTIMCYAGISSPDNIQPHSDAYFCGSSLIQMQKYITTAGDACSVKTPTGNRLVSLPAFTRQYTIPFETPFELDAPSATDSVNDTSITYCWEEWDLGEFGKSLASTHIAGPIFRSYAPTRNTTRIFPNLQMVLAGKLTDDTTNNAMGEKAPDQARYMNFRLTVRDIYNGYGCFLIPSDSIRIKVVNTGQGFKVTSQDEDRMVYLGNTKQTVTWNKVSTQLAPIYDSSVDIFLSADGGNTWAYYLGSFPNTGTASVILPNPDVSIAAARIKVKGTGNVFFNINGKDFRVDRNFEAAVNMYPVPAHDVLHITTSNSGIVQAAIYNVVGQRVWKGTINNGAEDIPVSLWARGMYIVRLMDSSNRPVVRRIVVE